MGRVARHSMRKRCQIKIANGDVKDAFYGDTALSMMMLVYYTERLFPFSFNQIICRAMSEEGEGVSLAHIRCSSRRERIRDGCM